MRGQSQFCDSIWCTLFVVAAVALLLLLAAIPAWAQSAVPPTAREATASPAFASRLARHVTPKAAGKRRASGLACSGLASPQDQVLYENGPVNGTTDAWTINFGYVVSDSFTVGGAYTVSGFDLYTWEFPGDTVGQLDWSITSGENGGTVYGSGTVRTTDTFISTNQYGYDIDKITASGLNVSLNAGTFWFNVQNASVASGDPVYWDENSGAGCKSSGCPSLASESGVGTIPSEAFDVTGGGYQYPVCFRAQPQDGFTIIHDFTGKEDGSTPSGLAIDKSGNLYGPAQSGGSGNGIVFKLFEAGSSWLLNPLYTFAGAANGSAPGGVIIGQNGTLYGAAQGGVQNCNGGYCGLIFDLRPSPTACRTSACSWTERPLYQFAGPTDASAGGALVADHAGNLYGVSASGGAQQKGAVFQLTRSLGAWAESILYSFTGGSDGAAPTDVIVGTDGNLYGTAASGGANGGGVVFQLLPAAGGWTETVLYDLPAMIEWGTTNPHSLLQDNAGNLFGEYQYFVQDYYDYNGIVFMLSPSNGKWVYTEIRKGDQPKDLFLNLIMDTAGNLWGAGGGVYGCAGSYGHGYIFKLTRASDGWEYSTPLVFEGNVTFPAGGALALDAQGNLYGTTGSCGGYDKGTAWQFTP